MKYLMSVIDDGTQTDDPDVQRREWDATGAFNDEMRAAGQFVFAEGLTHPDTATVVDNRGDAPLLTDGPFIESKEYLAGFWIVEAADLDEALDLAKRGSKACNRRVELRAVAQGDPEQ
ncbi:YciI family protein [Aestuariimicrobium soli]|uniref:YciI family protein n=1 Tax=Aestuariimicrobium soli TaxID=2035834 RepID=UPI003EBFEAAD